MSTESNHAYIKLDEHLNVFVLVSHLFQHNMKEFDSVNTI